MRQLFSRSFSSVYVHYVPLEGYGRRGSSNEILRQISRLDERIKQDAERVQNQRAESWIRFTTAQMSQFVHFAFTHLASGSSEPFDFDQCSRQISIPDTIEGYFSEFLTLSLAVDMEQRFAATAAVIATSLLRQYLEVNREGTLICLEPRLSGIFFLVLHPETNLFLLV